eukprot:jgi/Phyca11/11111/fgenesh1_pm.PHYCAscaffold_61_\
MRSTLARFGELNGGSTKSGTGTIKQPCNEALINVYRQQEAQISEELARCEKEVEMWQQRAADFEAQRDLEVVATRQAQSQRAQANTKAVQAVRGLALEREKLQGLAETVVRFTGGLVRDKMEQVHEGSARLEALERRLMLAKERVELAATLVTHRETRLRNSEAALEAERRVWAHRLEYMHSRRLQDNETETENGGDISNVVVRPPSDGKLLRPATETALRNLFHRLDPYDSGLFDSPQPTDQADGEAKAKKKPKHYKVLESLSHAELVQQNTVLLADRERLRRLLARDAHDLRDRVRSVRREWELKASELTHRNDRLQRSLNEQTRMQNDVEKRREAAEISRDEVSLEVQRLREQLSMQKEEFELLKTKLEDESAERLQHEQDVWQTEIQDARLAHSLLQADHSKQQVRIRQLERDLTRQKEALLAHESERVASLEDKVRRRDSELARLRRERNSILSSLREHEQKLALKLQSLTESLLAD